MAGYSLAVTAIPFRRTLVSVTLITMLVPAVALVLPLFLEVSALGLYNSPWAFILVSALNPFGVFLAYIHFSTAVPPELYEAARIDGVSETGIFFRIAFPLSKGLAGMVAFFAFTATWVNYFLPYVLLGKNTAFTLPVGLGVLFSATPALNPSLGASTIPIGRPEIALAGLVIAIPILVIFLLSSRFLVRGTFSGSVKS
jgi:multiple sugar transport system permease protein